jgi:aminomethyltransferase
MGLKTSLYDSHLREAAKIVDFGGWDMPLHYGSQIDEHHAVRGDAAMFDVSHMAQIDLRGERTDEFLRRLLANDVAKLREPGKGLYSCMLREDGGVIDDLIVYAMNPTWFRVVANAGTRAKDLAWLRAASAPFEVEVIERPDLAMIAVQGPAARAKAVSLFGPDAAARVLALGAFAAAEFAVAPGFDTAQIRLPESAACASGDCLVARTGYTGEDGFEISVPAFAAAAVWAALRAAGVLPAGLGARDTLRLEAGLSLYGNDLDEDHDPLASGLAWTVAFEPGGREFIGRQSLEALRACLSSRLRGLVLEDRGVLRSHQTVETALGLGAITSGTFSPTMNRSIALARLPAGSDGAALVDIRGKKLAARIVDPPFVRHGKILVPM